MGKHSVAEAKNSLSSLIDRALEGEDVVITRHGQPVVELRPVRRPARPMTAADVDWLAARRVGKTRSSVDAATLIRQLRDESEH
jgi:prevent-host-death family protein